MMRKTPPFIVFLRAFLRSNSQDVDAANQRFLMSGALLEAYKNNGFRGKKKSNLKKLLNNYSFRFQRAHNSYTHQNLNVLMCETTDDTTLAATFRSRVTPEQNKQRKLNCKLKQTKRIRPDEPKPIRELAKRRKTNPALPPVTKPSYTFDRPQLFNHALLPVTKPSYTSDLSQLFDLDVLNDDFWWTKNTTSSQRAPPNSYTKNTFCLA